MIKDGIETDTVDLEKIEMKNSLWNKNHEYVKKRISGLEDGSEEIRM